MADYQNDYLPGPLLKRIDLDSLEESQQAISLTILPSVYEISKTSGRDMQIKSSSEASVRIFYLNSKINGFLSYNTLIKGKKMSTE